MRGRGTLYTSIPVKINGKTLPRPVCKGGINDSYVEYAVLIVSLVVLEVSGGFPSFSVRSNQQPLKPL